MEGNFGYSLLSSFVCTHLKIYENSLILKYSSKWWSHTHHNALILMQEKATKLVPKKIFSNLSNLKYILKLYQFCLKSSTIEFSFHQDKSLAAQFQLNSSSSLQITSDQLQLNSSPAPCQLQLNSSSSL